MVISSHCSVHPNFNFIYFFFCLLAKKRNCKIKLTIFIVVKTKIKSSICALYYMVTLNNRQIVKGLFLHLSSISTFFTKLLFLTFFWLAFKSFFSRFLIFLLFFFCKTFFVTQYLVSYWQILQALPSRSQWKWWKSSQISRWKISYVKQIWYGKGVIWL